MRCGVTRRKPWLTSVAERVSSIEAFSSGHRGQQGNRARHGRAEGFSFVPGGPFAEALRPLVLVASFSCKGWFG